MIYALHRPRETWNEEHEIKALAGAMLIGASCVVGVKIQNDEEEAEEQDENGEGEEP